MLSLLWLLYIITFWKGSLGEVGDWIWPSLIIPYDFKNS